MGKGGNPLHRSSLLHASLVPINGRTGAACADAEAGADVARSGGTRPRRAVLFLSRGVHARYTAKRG